MLYSPGKLSMKRRARELVMRKCLKGWTHHGSVKSGKPSKGREKDADTLACAHKQTPQHTRTLARTCVHRTSRIIAVTFLVGNLPTGPSLTRRSGREKKIVLFTWRPKFGALCVHKTPRTPLACMCSQGSNVLTAFTLSTDE